MPENRPPTPEEYNQLLDTLSKENIYGGAVDQSHMAMSPIMGRINAAINPFLQRLHPLALMALSVAGQKAMGTGNRYPTIEELNTKSIEPDLKYEKKLKEKAAKFALEKLTK